MPFCRDCGKSVEADWKFCPNCNASQQSSVTVQDGVISGDVTVNNLHDIKEAMEQLLAEMGFVKDSFPDELTSEQTQQVERVLQISEQLVDHGVEVDPWTEIELGNAARLTGKSNDAQRHYLRGLNQFRNTGNLEGEGASLNNLGLIANERKNLDEAERLHKQSRIIMREIGNRQGEAASLNNLGIIALSRGDLSVAEWFFGESRDIKKEIGDYQGAAFSLNNLGVIAKKRGALLEAEQFYQETRIIMRKIGNREGEATSLNNIGGIAIERGDLAVAEWFLGESLTINREIGLRKGEAHSLIQLGRIMNLKGEKDKAHIMYIEAIKIQRELGIPIDQWFIDNGYSDQDQSPGGQNLIGNVLELQNINSHDEREVHQHIDEDNNVTNDTPDNKNKEMTGIGIIVVLLVGVFQISSFWENWAGAGGTILTLLPVLAVIGVIMLISWVIVLILNKYGIINLEWHN